jgi:PAS domain S-box-containing protein
MALSRQWPGANRPKVHILHLEDNALDGDLVCEYLHGEGLDCELDRVWTRDDFTAALRERNYDLILADHQLPNFDGESALEIARALAPETPFIFVSGTLGEDVAVEAMKRGATDYVVKQRLERLPAVVERALEEAAERCRRREVEASLKESEDKFATLVHAMPQLCWMANPDGYITWYNQRWHDYTGTTPSQMEGWGWTNVHDPEKLPGVLRRWQESIDTGQPFEMIFPLRGADGRFRPFLTRAEPVRDGRGRVVRWLGTNTDVSAQHEAEEALRRLNETLEQRIAEATAERAEMLAKLHEAQKLETIGQLTGGVAHDFNNLLTPIVGSLDLLRRKMDDDERAQRLISGALQAADRAKTLVQRLLAFGRRQVLEARPVDVVTLVQGMADLVNRSIGPQIRLEIEAPRRVHAAQVDPNQLELALLNLAVNARDAMPGGGTLRLAVTEQQIGQHAALKPGGYVCIDVTDTGIGMDEPTLRRAVEPFYSTKGIGRGTGLGLSMVHGLAAQSGGALLMSSKAGEGTRARIWLPFSSAEVREGANSGPAAVATLRPIAILLVDDEPLVRTATAAMLSDLGHSVQEAESGIEALQALRSEGCKPDLVITDYLMPGINGAELASELRQSRPDMPVLLLTGYANLDGVTGSNLPILPKPFREADLAAIIERIMAEPRPAHRAGRPAGLHVVER